MKKLLLLIVAAFVFLLLPQAASAQIFTTDKLITVDLGSQTVKAWNGGQVVYETKASTGMWLTPTVKGQFKIQRKVPLQDMRGPSPYKQTYPSGRYHIKDVPHVMYFYQGYAFHGAYWHNNFGVRASHGCVNLPPAAAEWLYNFADIGTKVLVF